MVAKLFRSGVNTKQPVTCLCKPAYQTCFSGLTLLFKKFEILVIFAALGSVNLIYIGLSGEAILEDHALLKDPLPPPQKKRAKKADCPPFDDR